MHVWTERSYSQDALAAARAKFEQQQRENERIAENNKRQKMGLPLDRIPAPGYQEVLSIMQYCLLSAMLKLRCPCFDMPPSQPHVALKPAAYILLSRSSLTTSSIADLLNGCSAAERKPRHLKVRRFY